MSYRIDEIVSALTLREFATLCSLIDEHAPKTSGLLGWGETAAIAGKLLQRKFNIVKIDRNAYSLHVTVDLGRGIIRKCEVRGRSGYDVVHAELSRVA
jgi:hypothetical protein